MRISDWSSDVCSSDLLRRSSSYRRTLSQGRWLVDRPTKQRRKQSPRNSMSAARSSFDGSSIKAASVNRSIFKPWSAGTRSVKQEQVRAGTAATIRSEEHTSELQSLMRISYAVFCLKKKKQNR